MVMKHSQQTIDFYGSRKAADLDYRKKLNFAIKRSKSDGIERFICDEQGEFVTAIGPYVRADFAVLASSFDFI